MPKKDGRSNKPKGMPEGQHGSATGSFGRKEIVPMGDISNHVIETQRQRATIATVNQSALEAIQGAWEWFSEHGIRSVSDANILVALTNAVLNISKCQIPSKPDHVTRVLKDNHPSKDLSQAVKELNQRIP